MRLTFHSIIRILFSLSVLIGWQVCWAHSADDNYLSLLANDTGQVNVVWGIPERNLEGMQPDHAAITEIALSSLAIFSDEKLCPLEMGSIENQLKNEIAYLRLKLIARCPGGSISKLGLNWSFQSANGGTQNAMVYFQSGGKVSPISVTNRSGRVDFDLTPENAISRILTYIKDGFLHIWTGPDHILFLIALLLPAVFIFRNGYWDVKDNVRAIFFDVLKTVSAFTLGHSLTLCLVTYKMLPPPGQTVEVLIAATIFFAGMNNIKPVFKESRWMMGLVFGTIHGMAFAEALVGLELSQSALIKALIGYNCGVELGQLVIVLTFVPMAYILRKKSFYRRYIFQGGSVGTAGIAVWWMISRLLA